MSHPGRLIIAVILLCSASVFAETSLYEVSKGGQKIYLGGTIHVLRNSDYPLPAEFEQAYEKSQVLVLETDPKKSNSPEFGQQFAQTFMYSGGKNLAQDLQPELWQELQSYAAKNQFPLDQMSTFKAMFVSLTISIAEMQKRGYGLGQGVDMYFFQKANLHQKPIQELESIGDVLQHMKALTDLDANQVISSALRDVKKMDKALNVALKYWRVGELEKLDKELATDMRKETPEVYQRLLVDRNQEWLPKIETLITTKETELVLVGALHLSGDQGLLARLKARGYHIKPYQLTK
ncbi:TraB/GumN family protein [Cellvibrio mixtus]|uniref:TraB/GumN family protein n=1 Tax=Cellvibrio mixtus TaxID=39650 RepID=UPI00058712BF|nr:TraB/GumN family protein [Cellvibrio mixtus]